MEGLAGISGFKGYKWYTGATQRYRPTLTGLSIVYCSVFERFKIRTVWNQKVSESERFGSESEPERFEIRIRKGLKPERFRIRKVLNQNPKRSGTRKVQNQKGLKSLQSLDQKDLESDIFVRKVWNQKT
jgi:hypothetical protein